MKKKFEDNVAGRTPDAGSKEPALPWKIDESELAGVESSNEDYGAIERGEPPFKTRPVLLAVLLIAVFAFAILTLTDVTFENDRIKAGISEKEKEASALQSELEKASSAAEELRRSASELEKKLGDLSAQKELFTAVLESVAKTEELPGSAPGPAAAARESAQ